MANKIINDYGQEVTCVGQKGSKEHTRIAYPKLIKQVADKRINIYISYDGLSRHLSYSEMEAMCEDAGLTDKITIGHVVNISGGILNDYLTNNKTTNNE